MWTDGVCQQEFADAFDVQPLKVPTVIVYAPKKGRYASFVGSLSDEGLQEFLAGVLSGRIGTKPMSTPPVPGDMDCSKYVRDGGGEAEAVEEDDTDMGDMMAEILADEKREKEERDAKAKKEEGDEKEAAALAKKK